MDLFGAAFNQQSDAEQSINQRLESLVQLQIQIEQPAFTTDGQLKQAKELFESELTQILKINPKYLVSYKKIKEEKLEKLKVETKEKIKNKNNETIEKVNRIANFEFLDPKETFKIKHDLLTYSVTFTPDQKYIITAGNDKVVKITELATGNLILKFENFGLRALSYSPHAKHLVLWSKNLVKIIELPFGNKILNITHNFEIYWMNFSPDGKYVVTVGYDKLLKITDLSTGKTAYEVRHNDSFESAEFSSDGKSILAICNSANTIQLYKIEKAGFFSKELDLKLVLQVNDPGRFRSAKLSADGKYIHTTLIDFSLKTFELKNRIFRGPKAKLISESEKAKDVNSSFSKTIRLDNKDTDITVVLENRVARIIELSTGKELSKIEHLDNIEDFNFNLDGKYIATLSSNKEMKVSEVLTGKTISVIDYVDSVESFKLSPDGKYVVTTSDSKMKLISTESKETLHELQRDTSQSINQYKRIEVKFSSDSKYVVVLLNERETRIIQTYFTIKEKNLAPN